MRIKKSLKDVSLIMKTKNHVGLSQLHAPISLLLAANGVITYSRKDTTVTQKFCIFSISFALLSKWGCRSLLYFCSTWRMSSLAFSLSSSISLCTLSISLIASCVSLPTKERMQEIVVINNYMELQKVTWKPNFIHFYFGYMTLTFML